MKKERGKTMELLQNYSSSTDFPCKKHPSAYSVGICPHCLRDRLLNLVCSDCGEQRISSCSCSEISSSNRNSCSVEVGRVGRVSFLIENDNQKNELLNSKPDISLQRSSSSCVEMKRRNGIWGIGKLFRKKKEKSNFDQRNDLCVSRSRSLCSFRNGGFFGSEDWAFSGARSSISAARKSGFSETTEPRKSVFSVKDGSFTTVDDDSGFIDLKFNLSSESKSEMQNLYLSSGHGSTRLGGDFQGEQGEFNNGGSCRITVSDRGIKRSRKSFRSWRWIFRQNSVAGRKDYDDDLTVKNLVG